MNSLSYLTDCFQLVAKSISSIYLIKPLTIIVLYFCLPSLNSLSSFTERRICSTISNMTCNDPKAKCIHQSGSFIGRCECDPGYHPSIFFNPYCTKSMRFGETCSSSRECQLFDPSSTCSSLGSGTCKCKDGYSYDQDRSKCSQSFIEELATLASGQTEDFNLFASCIFMMLPLGTILIMMIIYSCKKFKQSICFNQIDKKQTNLTVSHSVHNLDCNQNLPSPTSILSSSDHFEYGTNYDLSVVTLSSPIEIIIREEDEPPSYMEAVHATISSEQLSSIKQISK